MAVETFEIRSDVRARLAKLMQGHVTCVEGVDGAGKTTMVQWLASELRKDVEVFDIREPGGTDLGERVREILLHGRRASDAMPMQMHMMSEILMFQAARVELYYEVVVPKLRAGSIVLADRSLYSTIAYQCFGRALERDISLPVADILALAEMTMPKISKAAGMVMCARPTFTIVLDVDPETRAARMGTTLDNIESRGVDFFNRVRTGYREIARTVPNVVLLSGIESLVKVKANVFDALFHFYNARS